MGYRGLVVELPLGPDGLTGTKNQSQVRPTQLIKAPNITYENGTLQKEPGSTKYNAAAITGAPTIMAGWDWFPAAGVQRMIVVTSAGAVLRDDGSGTFATTLTSGLSLSGSVPFFVEAGKEAQANNRKLFLLTGLNQVQVLSGDGVAMTPLATPPADWAAGAFPKAGVIHESRFWGFLGHRAYASRPDNHEDFTIDASANTAVQLAVYPGEGEEIIAAFVFGPFIIVGKRPQGIYLIDTSSPTVANWKVKRLTRQIGFASPQAFAIIDGDVIIMDVSGELFALSVFSELVDVRPRSLTEAAEFSPFLRDNTNPAHYSKVTGIYYAAKRQAWFAVAGFGAAVNTARIKLDANRAGILRFGFSTFVTCESLWLRKDLNGIPRPVAGDNAGFVRLLDQSSRAHDSLGYQAEFQTPHLDFSHLGDPKLASKRKQGQFLELVMEPVGNWNLTVDVLWDGVITQVLTFNLGHTGAALDSFLLDTDVLAGDQVLNRKRRLVGGGKRLSILGRNNGVGQDFSIARAYFHGVLGDERETIP